MTTSSISIRLDQAASSTLTPASLHHAPRATVFASFSTTCKCIIGSGIMSLPYAFYQSGWLVGVFFLILVALLSYSTMTLIIAAVHLTRARLRRRKNATIAHAAALAGASFSEGENGTPANVGYGSLNQSAVGSPSATAVPGSISPARSPFGSPRPTTDPTDRAYMATTDRPVDPLDLSVIEADPDLDVIGYQQVAYVAFGNVGRIIADTVLIFCQVGSCAAFLVLVMTNLQACLASYGIHWSLYLIGLFLVPIVIALSLPRSTTYLAPAAHFGNLTLLIGVATIIYFGITSRTSELEASHHEFGHIFRVISELPVYSGRPYGILVFFGISAFAFAAHCEIVAVEADAQSRQVYAKVLPLSIIFIACLYVFVGIFAYSCFGDQTKANILLNLGTSFFVNFVRVTLSCTLLVNFCLALFPASQTLDLLIAGPAPVSRDLPHQHENTPKSKLSSPATRAAANGTTTTNETTTLLQPSPKLQWPIPRTSSGNTLTVPPSTSTSSGLPRSASGTSLFSPDSPQPMLSVHEEALRSWHRKGNMIRVGVVLFTFAFGLLVQDLGVLFSLVGSVAGGILCFSMPALFWYRLMVLERQPMSLFIQVSLFVQTMFGLAFVVMGIIVVVVAA